MRQPALVTEYLDALARELRFDGELSRRVRQEARDHLLEAINNEAGDVDAARRAITRFGDPRALARQYVPLSMLQQVRRVGAILIVAIAAILLLMKGRAAIFDLLGWRIHPDWLGIASMAPTVDRYSFQVALVLGILGWVYIASFRVTPTFAASQHQLRRWLLLPIAAAGLLGGSVILDAILGALRLVHVQPSTASAILLASIAIEAALVVVIGALLRRTFRSAALAASLFAPEKANG